MNTNKPFRNFEVFYPFYLGEHSNRECRRFHFIGTTASLILIAGAFVTQSWQLIGLAFSLGYGLAWMGHFFFERNRPATFKFPWYSFLGDWRMWRDIVKQDKILIDPSIKTSSIKYRALSVSIGSQHRPP